MGERLPYKQRVTGSSPVSSISYHLSCEVVFFCANSRQQCAGGYLAGVFMRYQFARIRAALVVARMESPPKISMRTAIP